MRKHPNHVRQPVEHSLNWHRDLFFNLLRRPAWVERDDVDLNIRNIRKSFDRKIVERGPAARDEQDCHQHHEQGLMEREANDAFYHFKICCSNTHPSVTTRCPASSPAMMAI